MDGGFIFLIVLACFLAFAICLVLTMTSIPACCIKPTYGDLRLLSEEHEADMIAQNKPLNHYHVVGTHNGEHVASLFSVFVAPWRYTHLSFVDQLDCGLRHLEIDMWLNRVTNRWVVYHEIVDKLINCSSNLETTLIKIRDWSLAHPGHFPVHINLDIKGAYNPVFKLCRGCMSLSPDDEDKTVFRSLETHIRNVFKDQHLLRPADLMRGRYTTLGEAISREGWLPVGQLTGRVFFVLNLYSEKQGCREWHRCDEASVMFKRGDDANLDHPDSCVFECGDAGHVVARNFLCSALYFTDNRYTPSSARHEGEQLRKDLELGVQCVRSNHPTWVMEHAGMKQSVHLSTSPVHSRVHSPELPHSPLELSTAAAASVNVVRPPTADLPQSVGTASPQSFTFHG